ncbi:hypothetical protein Pelo_10746 [Pelomyxa schiedti]|nr:hypothetical protein Pelo_10746 [Pelomyxa schiedti]
MPLLRLSHQWRSLSFTEYLRVIEKVLCCLGGLHSRGEVHGDLCPDTIGVSMSPLEVCLGEPLKLTTPGQQFSTCNYGNSVFFDPYWAPELITLRNLSPSSDIYAIGSTVLEWINNGPLESPTPEDSSDSKVISVTKILEKRDFTMPQYFMSMLDLCFRLNPQERPTWSQLRNAIRKYIVELVLDHPDARNFWSRCCLWCDVVCLSFCRH